MLNIPGHRAYTCEGPTRRELMRIGSIGLMGLSLPHFFLWRERATGRRYRQQVCGRAWVGERPERGDDLPARRTVAHRYLGPQTRCAGEYSRRVQAHQDQDPRHPGSASICP